MRWLIADSGCTKHMVHDKQLFSNYRTHNGRVDGANPDAPLEAVGIGDVTIQVNDSDNNVQTLVTAAALCGPRGAGI